MKLLLRPTTHFKLKAFVHDFYAKIQTNTKFNLSDLINHHNISKSAYMALDGKYQLVTKKGDECKYAWLGNAPTEEDIIMISNKMYEIGKEYNVKNKIVTNKIEFPNESQPDIESLKNQLSMLQDMFSKFIK